MMKTQTALIIGAGDIAKEYVKILKSFGARITVVCRDLSKAQALAQSFEVQAFGGGIEDFLKNTQESFDLAINAVVVENLFQINKLLLQSDRVKKILTEKPGAITVHEFEKLSVLSLEKQIPLFIAYNRRFFSATLKLKDILKSEKMTSSFFEFTEWFWKINTANFSQVVLDEWFLANSSHVVDLAFFLGGGVASLATLARKEDPNARICDQYVGHGSFLSGAVFSYIADWKSAGRWKVEVSTIEGRYMLCPLEKLYFQKRGTLEYVEIPLENSLDLQFKTGFYRQVEAFLSDKPTGLKSIVEQKNDMKYFDQMKGKEFSH